jgi:hypothetical protein
MAASTTIGSLAPLDRSSAMLRRMLSRVAGHTIEVSWFRRSGFPKTMAPSFLRSIVLLGPMISAPKAAMTAS